MVKHSFEVTLKPWSASVGVGGNWNMQIEKLQLKEQCHVIFYPRFLSSSIYVTHLAPSFICFSIFVQGFDFAETFISTLNNVHSTVGLTRGVRLVVIDKEESTIVSLIKALVSTNFPPLFSWFKHIRFPDFHEQKYFLYRGWRFWRYFRAVSEHSLSQAPRY